MLRDFLEASYMGWRDVMDNPKAALEIFKKRVPEIDLSIIEPNMMLGLELMKTDRYAKNGIGWMDAARCAAPSTSSTPTWDMPRKVGLRRGLHQRVPDQDRAAEVRSRASAARRRRG